MSKKNIKYSYIPDFKSKYLEINSQFSRHQLDENGKEILLGPSNQQMMMEWEKPYMEACIQKLNPYGDVLEIGFGLGYSASEIQKYNVNSHTIIEVDPIVCEKALEWAEQYDTNIHIINGEWPYLFDRTNKYDCFFFDPCLINIPKILEETNYDENAFYILDAFKNLSKKRSRYSYYSVGYDEHNQQIKNKLSKLNVEYKAEFDVFSSCVVPKNCFYINDRTIYVPYIEIIKP
jgi:hypothetical protein